MFLKDYLVQIDDTVETTATLHDVVNKMAKNSLHHIVIIENKKPVGIITERDFVRYYSKNIDFQSLAIDHAITDIITLHHTRMIEYALSMMLHNNIRKIIVINCEDEYLGTMEQEELIFCLESRIHEKEVKLHQLTHPGNKAVLISENSNLHYALELMSTNQLTSLLVTSEEKVVGIISESDIIRLAHNNVDQEEKVKDYMHSPIIQIEEYKTADDMVMMMQKNKVRRLVVYNSRDEQYYTLTSKDVASAIKGNYTSFIEAKFFDTRDTFNALSEYVIELIDIDDDQVVFWTNGITKANFDIHLDDSITKMIPVRIWKKLYRKLLENNIIYETIDINDGHYQVKGHYGSISNDNVIKIFLNDITEIIELNKQLQKEIEHKDQLLFNQAKMVQMGEMIGNIAHQWRQPLSLISTISTGIKLQKDFGTYNDKSLFQDLDTINENAQYLSKTIDTFRNFIKEEKQFKKVVLQDRINKALDIVSTSLSNNHIKIINEIDYKHSITISVVLGELVQVLINIINNAKDAILGNGIVDPWVKLELTKTTSTVLITIEDNAGGVPEEIIDKIFEPYFSTKNTQNGTGLGLHMSRRIMIESLKGDLYVQNTSHGAKFFIELPLD